MLKTRYGITELEFKKKVLAQKNRCAICLRSFKLTKCCVDHNHKTGKVRGLLCLKCNNAIGLLNDDPSIVKRAERYINKYANS